MTAIDPARIINETALRILQAHLLPSRRKGTNDNSPAGTDMAMLRAFFAALTHPNLRHVIESASSASKEQMHKPLLRLHGAKGVVRMGTVSVRAPDAAHPSPTASTAFHFLGRRA